MCEFSGISRATFYKWRAKYGVMDVSMMSRMKELEDESLRLKKMYLEEKLKTEIVAEALEKKWCGHLAEKRWPSKRLPTEVCPSGWPARRSGSANLVIATNADLMPRTKRWPSGSFV
jgi:putative transposase